MCRAVSQEDKFGISVKGRLKAEKQLAMRCHGFQIEDLDGETHDTVWGEEK